MDATKFKRQAETLIQGFQHLIRKMPQKGNTATTCQRMTLQKALNGLAKAVNGVTDADFIDNEDHDH
ncbi:hypothetical protein MTsPCn9_10360 [Croceitalea sp. MTPC9]|nr:hypothetical protein MTsPCn6_26880 [Croceitalea sp. MTPC6]GMN16100.1 hypothetical protein MTsPCn9_10360 [Croceitalea sp. MTPC9]